MLKKYYKFWMFIYIDALVLWLLWCLLLINKSFQPPHIITIVISLSFPILLYFMQKQAKVIADASEKSPVSEEDQRKFWLFMLFPIFPFMINLSLIIEPIRFIIKLFQP